MDCSILKDILLLFIGAFLGLIISLIWDKINEYIFHLKYLKPLRGNYNCYYKNGKIAIEIKCVQIYDTKNKVVFIRTKNNNGVVSESEVFFHLPKNGFGWYIETENQNPLNSSKTFGKRELIIVSNNQINVWDKYAKDSSYGANANFECINKNYLWIREEIKTNSLKSKTSILN